MVNIPDDYYDMFDAFPTDVTEDNTALKDFIHFFSRNMSEVKVALPKFKKEIVQNGMIWVSWPKKASKVKTDITEDLIRSFALSIDLVDIKVCAVDGIWSGLKLVIPVKLRRL